MLHYLKAVQHYLKAVLCNLKAMLHYSKEVLFNLNAVLRYLKAVLHSSKVVLRYSKAVLHYWKEVPHYSAAVLCCDVVLPVSQVLCDCPPVRPGPRTSPPPLSPSTYGESRSGVAENRKNSRGIGHGSASGLDLNVSRCNCPIHSIIHI